MYGIRYLRVFDNVSVSECAIAPVTKSEVCHKRPQIEKNKPAHLSLPYDHLVPCDSSPFGAINTQQLEVEMKL